MAKATILNISDNDYKYLQELCRCRTIQAQIVDRAKILIYKAQGESNQAIADCIDVNINTVKLCLKKYRHGGIKEALYDAQRTGRPIEITDDVLPGLLILPARDRQILGIPKNYGH